MHLAFICKSFSLGITLISEDLSTLEQSLSITNFTLFIFLFHTGLFPPHLKRQYSVCHYSNTQNSVLSKAQQLNTTKPGILSSSHSNIQHLFLALKMSAQFLKSARSHTHTHTKKKLFLFPFGSQQPHKARFRQCRVVLVVPRVCSVTGALLRGHGCPLPPSHEFCAPGHTLGWQGRAGKSYLLFAASRAVASKRLETHTQPWCSRVVARHTDATWCLVSTEMKASYKHPERHI